MKIPETVQGDEARSMYQACLQLRADIKDVAGLVNDVRQHAGTRGNGEAVANVTLAYRHLEDASMRLGKALQALDGGVSVYDKATTVGA